MHYLLICQPAPLRGPNHWRNTATVAGRRHGSGTFRHAPSQQRIILLIGISRLKSRDQLPPATACRF